VFAELGSLNPCFVTAAAGAARTDEIARGLAESVSGSSGQLCTKPGVVFAPSAVLDALAPLLVQSLVTPAVPLLTAPVRAGLAHQLDETTALAGVVGLGPGPRASGTGLGFVGVVLRCSLATFVSSPSLREEQFGPVCVLVDCDDAAFPVAIASLDAALVGTIHAEPEEVTAVAEVLAALVPRVGRVVFNGMPTGLRIVHAMHHGGPWPATTNAQVTSVGGAALDRFLRPVAFQSVPDALLPASLQAANPRGLTRMVEGVVVAPDP
jgi:NADP-dependent aldehyde dehydrogenase